jgi:hypothetical protein
MAKEKLEDLSIEELKKRKKFAFLIVGVCIGISLVSLGLGLLSFFKGRLEGISSFVPGLVLIMIAVIMSLGVKKIDAELARRNVK